jgi:hypothetical protein
VAGFDPRVAAAVGRNTPTQRFNDAAAAARLTRDADQSAPTIQRVGKPVPLPPTSGDVAGTGLTDGEITTVAKPSPGQVVGLLSALLPGGSALDTADSIIGALTGRRPPTAAPDGGPFGRIVDSLLGTTPGQIAGTTPNHIAGNTNSRASNAGGGAEPMGYTYGRVGDGGDDDEASPPAGGDLDFDSVQMKDRRKPRVLDTTGAGTRAILGL